MGHIEKAREVAQRIDDGQYPAEPTIGGGCLHALIAIYDRLGEQMGRRAPGYAGARLTPEEVDELARAIATLTRDEPDEPDCN